MSEASKGAREVIDLGLARSVEIRGHLVGWIARWSGDGPMVDFPANPHGPILARTIVPVAKTDGAGASCQRREVLLVFEAERSHRPVIVGLLEDTRVQLVEQPLSQDQESPQCLDALVDGRRVVLEGKDEVVLRCGKASITLRRNGRVIVRGTYVETDSAGVNRLKGGSVRIN